MKLSNLLAIEEGYKYLADLVTVMLIQYSSKQDLSGRNTRRVQG